jgi:hypothetical protein
MKFTTLRASAALALMLALAGCGGKASFDVSGSVLGLGTPGLILTMGGNDDVSVAPAAGSANFTFGRRLSYGDAYSITVKHQPDYMTCSPYRGTSGTAGQTTNIAAIFNCTQNVHDVTGWVTGLTGKTDDVEADKLALTNGSIGGQALISVTSDGSNPVFAFTSIAEGTAYGITVLRQPKGQFCSVTNGTGVMANFIVSNVQVSCKPQ